MFRRLLFALALLCLPTITHAFTIYPIPQSGLLSESGIPVNGTRYFTFNLYDVPAGGASIYPYSESLAVIGGVYHAFLPTMLGHWSDPNRWIGVSVNSGPELVPRVQVGTVPFAVRATYADSIKFGPGGRGNTIQFDSQINSEYWKVVHSGFVEAPAVGFAVMTVCATLLNGDGAYRGELMATTSLADTTGVAIYPFGSGNPPSTWSGGSIPEIPISYTKSFEVPAGPCLVYIWARKRPFSSSANFYYSGRSIHVMWYPKSY